MASVNATEGFDLEPVHRAPAVDRGLFYTNFAWLCLAIAVLGFVPSFWLPLGTRAFNGSWLVVSHGVLFTGWAIFFLTQTRLVESGRLANHRKWGVAGVSLATMLLLVSIATVEAQLTDRLAAGFGDKARSFAIVPLTNVALFFGLIAAAVGMVARTHWHKRLMMVATAIALTPPLARFFFVLVDGRPFGAIPAVTPPGTPLLALRPGALVVVLLVGTALIDRKRIGKIHPAWLWGTGAYVVVAIGRIPLSGTTAWRAFTDFLVAFA